MDIRKEKIKKEQQQIIGIVPNIDMKNFVILLLADLASKTCIIRFDDSDIKTACLSTEYKKIIEDIMYQENGWGIKFATLIDIYSYYEFQSDWEKKLGKTIEQVLNELNKTFVYDFENDIIKMDFTSKEIEDIKSRYDEETLANMDHFTNLISNTVFNRRHKLETNEMNRETNRSMYENYELQVCHYRNSGLRKPKEYKKYIGEFKPKESKY